MLILGLDTTGNTLSVALCEDEKLLGETTINDTKKHSVTLLPAVSSLLSVLGRSISEVELIAVSVGPGSFTGIRIGVASAIGLAQSLRIPVAQIDALDALLENVFFDGTICAIMDARREQVYAAAKKDNRILVESCATGLADLLPLLGNGPAMFVGDGIDQYKDMILKSRPDSLFAKEAACYQRASSVCALGLLKCRKEEITTYRKVRANYLRPSQAERLKKAK